MGCDTPVCSVGGGVAWSGKVKKLMKNFLRMKVLKDLKVVIER